jgi:lipid-A-disaccharide synthase-like uncharacterized protein
MPTHAQQEGGWAYATRPASKRVPRLARGAGQFEGGRPSHRRACRENEPAPAARELLTQTARSRGWYVSPGEAPVETVNPMDLFTPITAKLASWWLTTSAIEKSWLAVGLIGQLMFSMRWVLQWLASEKARSSVVPTTFWYYSLLGGLMVLSYGIYKVDPVIILGQFGVLVYARNIYLLLKGGPEAAPVEPVTSAD